MLILGLDLETSGIDKKTSKILEIAYVLKRVGEPRAWLTRSEYIYDPSWGDDFIPHEAQLVNGIHPDICRRFGVALSRVAFEINALIKTHKVDAFIGHNVRNFDLPFLLHHIEGYSTDHWDEIKTLPVIDTLTDIEYPKNCKSKALTYLCADHGFLNTGAHSALHDVIATMRLGEFYDLQAALKRGKEPSAIYKSNTVYETRQKAKDAGFSWENLEGRNFPKQWVKRLRESEIEATVAKLGCGVQKIAE
jgi:DNA polymerase-3 subunit epsilon